MSRKWYNNGIIQVFTDKEPEDGFIPGMLQSSKDKMHNYQSNRPKSHSESLSKSHMGISPSNKGVPCSEETKRKISNSLKGKPSPKTKKRGAPWNKGLTKETDERVLKSSITFKNNFSDEHREICRQNGKRYKGIKLSEETKKKKLIKDYATRKLHNTFNSSSKEEIFYKQLLDENENKTIERQYRRDSRYPYSCDFYIVEDDLFIECNFHWTHGGKPYDPNDESCQEQLKEWEEKAKTSQFYRNAIETWTIRDVEKQKCAKENNLNYKVMY